MNEIGHADSKTALEIYEPRSSAGNSTERTPGRHDPDRRKIGSSTSISGPSRNAIRPRCSSVSGSPNCRPKEAARSRRIACAATMPQPELCGVFRPRLRRVSCPGASLAGFTPERGRRWSIPSGANEVGPAGFHLPAGPAVPLPHRSAAGSLALATSAYDRATVVLLLTIVAALPPAAARRRAGAPRLRVRDRHGPRVRRRLARSSRSW